MKRLAAPSKESCPGYAPLPLLAPVQKICLRALCGLPVLNPIGKQPVMAHSLFRSLAVLACLSLISPPRTLAATKPDQPDKPNFSGTWTLDLKASTSLEPLMKEVGAGVLKRKFAAWAKLKATFHQTEDVLRVALPAAQVSH